MKYDDYSRTTTFGTTSRRFRLSKLPQPKIKFNFFFKSDYINIFQNQKFTTLPSKKQSASAVVAVEEGSDALFEDMVEAFVEAIGNRLVDKDLEDLIDLAWAEVSKVFPAKTLMPKYNFLYLRFDVRSEHRYMYGDCPPKIPSAGVKEERRCCCICLEELEGGDGGGGALRMPCLHLFHGGCIKAWLRKSSCCPLCRYEMPKM